MCIYVYCFIKFRFYTYFRFIFIFTFTHFNGQSSLHDRKIGLIALLLPRKLALSEVTSPTVND